VGKVAPMMSDEWWVGLPYGAQGRAGRCGDGW